MHAGLGSVTKGVGIYTQLDKKLQRAVFWKGTKNWKQHIRIKCKSGNGACCWKSVDYLECPLCECSVVVTKVSLFRLGSRGNPGTKAIKGNPGHLQVRIVATLKADASATVSVPSHTGHYGYQMKGIDVDLRKSVITVSEGRDVYIYYSPKCVLGVQPVCATGEADVV